MQVRSRFLADIGRDTPPEIVRVPAHLADRWERMVSGAIGSAETNITHFAAHFRGGLNADIMRDAARRLIARHTILKYTIRRRDSSYEYCPYGARIDIAEIDLTTLSAQSDDLVKAAISNYVWRPFNVADEPLLKMAIFRIGGGHAVFVMVVHHIISDLISLQILFRELASIYLVLQSGSSATPSSSRLSYLSYLDYINKWIETEDAVDYRSHWRSTLQSAPETRLPLCDAQCLGKIGAYRSIYFHFEASLITRLEMFSRAIGASIFMVILTAKLLAMSRLSGLEELAIFVVSSGRAHPDLANMVGSLNVNLPLHVRVDRKAPPGALIPVVSTAFAKAFNRQLFPPEIVIKELFDERQPPAMPIINYTQVNTGIGHDKSNKPKRITHFAVDNPTPGRIVSSNLLSHYLQLINDGSTLSGRIIYHELMHDATVVGDFLDNIHTILEDMSSEAAIV